MSEMGFVVAVASESLKDTFASTSFYQTVLLMTSFISAYDEHLIS